MNVIDYKVIECNSSAELTSKIREAIHERWDVWGGPVVAFTPSTKAYCQAVVKYAKPSVAQQ